MKVQDKVVVTSPFHAYRGHTGVVTLVTEDRDGVVILARFGDGKEIMLEPADVRVA
jgi:hypothetical protein